VSIDGQLFDCDTRHFSFSANHQIREVTELSKLAMLSRLESASFVGSGLDDHGLKLVVKSSAIDNLNLQQTRVSNEGLASLAQLKRLRFLRLKENFQISNECIPHILSLHALVDLQIHETSIDQHGLRKLVPLCNLRDICLDVTHSNYSFASLLEISGLMPKCTILAKGRGDFCNGSFEGTWPTPSL
jgi:hypothetical protein